MLALADYLRYETVDEGGQPTMRKIPALQISVRPESNFPFKWENSMATLSKYSGLTYPDGTPVVPMQVIQKMLAEKFPIIDNPQYKIESEAMRIGMEVMKQQQAAAAEAEKQKQDVLDQVKNKKTQQIVNQLVPNQ